MDFAMNPTTIGWMLALNVVVVASFILNPFKIHKRTFGEEVPQFVGPRIFNGMEAEEGQFKFMMFTYICQGQNNLQCSSSLVTPSWVLTAAHCLSSPGLGDVMITGGRADLTNYLPKRRVTPFDEFLMEETYGVQERLAKRIYIHPDYNNTTNVHDIALIRTKRPFVLGESLTTIPLSTQKMTSNKICTILGWGLGSKSPPKLNYVDGKEASTTEFECIYIPGNFICLKQDDGGPCPGDSGSPLVCEGEVWGVASHSRYPLNASFTCGSRIADVYVDIYYDLEWIRGHISSEHVSCGIRLKSLISCAIITFWVSLKV